MSITSVRLNEEINSGLELAAAKTRRTKSWLINEAVRDYLVRMEEDAERWRDTLEALDQVKRGELADGAEVLKWLASWGKAAETQAPRKLVRATPARIKTAR